LILLETQRRISTSQQEDWEASEAEEESQRAKHAGETSTGWPSRQGGNQPPR
jgi:hypothetical protein